MTTTIGPDQIAQRLAALNYVQYVYATGAEAGMLGDAIRDKNFDPIVAQAARTTRRRKQAYFCSAADVAAAARTANAWSLLASADGFLIGTLAGDPELVQVVFAVKPDGSAASLPLHQLFDGDPGAAPASDDVAASIAKVSADQPWTIGVTTDGHLAFRLGGQLKFAVLADGYAYAAGGGILKTDRQFAYQVAPELRRVWPPESTQKSYGGWRFSITFGGEFVIGNGDQVMLVIDADGSVWNAGAGGKLVGRTSEAAVAAVPSGPALALAAVISIGGDSYNTASSWVTGAAYDVGDWFKGAAGSLEDGFDCASTFTQATAADATYWLSGAGSDSAHAIAGAASSAAEVATAAANAATEAMQAAANAAARAAEDAANATAQAAVDAANATARAAQDAADALKHAAEQTGRALNPSNW